MIRWPHQDRGINASIEAIKQRLHSVITAPPGAGKSFMMREITRWALNEGLKVSLYLHRNFLFDQTVKAFEDDSLPYGCIAAEYDDHFDQSQPVQICSIQTVYRRFEKPTFRMHDSDIIIWDECHDQTANMAKEVMYGSNRFKGYHELGAVNLGFSATPVNLKGIYFNMINAGTYREMRQCGAHLPIMSFHAEQPYTKGMKKGATGEYSEAQVRDRMKVPQLFGNVYDNWRQHNPDALPAILFAAGVPESKWFQEDFARRGVPAGHIDGEQIILPREIKVDGIRKIVLDAYNPCESSRADLMEMSKDGSLKIICNRFVLREAVDMPWLFSCHLATIFGGIAGFLQSVGRIQRFFKGYARKVLCDHGGNVDRHLMPNMDRAWKLGDTNQTVAKVIHDQVRNTKGADGEPLVCGKCGAYRWTGAVCPNCKKAGKMSVRRVRMADGTLKAVRGRLIKPKKTHTADDIVRSAIFAMAKNDRQVYQAMRHAKTLAKKADFQGDLFADSNIPTYTKADPEWRMTISQVYPRFMPKNKS